MRLKHLLVQNVLPKSQKTNVEEQGDAVDDNAQSKAEEIRDEAMKTWEFGRDLGLFANNEEDIIGALATKNKGRYEKKKKKKSNHRRNKDNSSKRRRKKVCLWFFNEYYFLEC